MKPDDESATFLLQTVISPGDLRRHTRCITAGMSGARRFEDLIAWQVAVQLRDLICRMIDHGPVLKDFKFRDQIRDSARSAPANIAEGFARFDPPEFAHFLNIARSSLSETQDHLIHGRDQKYFKEEDFTAAWRLACRALRASNRLHAYLRSCGRKKPFTPPRPSRNPAERKPAESNLAEPKAGEPNLAEPKPGGTEPCGTEPWGTEP